MTLQTQAPVVGVHPAQAVEDRAYGKVFWRIVPFLMLCYVVAYLDRVNVGFAKLQMSSELGLSEAAYGIGAGIFFIGYFLFEVPSNVIMNKVGARVWIARIMITWGIISAAFMFTSSETVFYVLRFLLGVAEAGFFPGIILYLTAWYPANRRTCSSWQRPTLHQPVGSRVSGAAGTTRQGGGAKVSVDRCLHSRQRTVDDGPLQRALRALVSA